jgi:F-type H+-transporting ATPase subunit gamma
VAAIVIGSDHGLCGRFNEQIVRYARSSIQNLNSSNTEVLWLALSLRAGTLA